MFESVPTYPDPGRYWEMVERLKINQFYTAPTAIRAIARESDEYVTKYDRSSLRILGTVGEPINPDTWKWYYEVVGESRCAIVDTWWQTETGGIMITPLPGATSTKPGSATLPFFGIEPVLLTEEGNEIEGTDVSGLLAIKNPWPAMARTIQGDHQRFLKTYLTPFNGYYLTGDGARRDEDGYYWITGRVDDVIKGEGIFAYVLVKEGYGDEDELVGALKNEVRIHIGPIATPDHVLILTILGTSRRSPIRR